MLEQEKKKVGASELLAAAVAIATGTQAYAEVIIFNNPEPGEPGHFEWAFGPDGPPGSPAQWLDIRRPSTDQGGGVGPSSVGQIYTDYFLGNYTYSGASVARTLVDNSPYYHVGVTRAFSGGALIGRSVGPFDSHSSHWTRVYAGGQVYSDFQVGQIRYMGVRFNDVDGDHYGWISVVRTGTFAGFDAFAWGYETDPGVPISAGIPAPGTLAALAFGAVVTRRGRKRKED